MKRIAIIGAGPMGLATAYYLTEKGFMPDLFECDDRVGGMSASFDFNGITIEKYYHFINRQDKHLFELLKSLDIYDKLRWVHTKMGFFKKDRDGIPTLYEWGNPLALIKFKESPLLTRLRYGVHVFLCKFYKDLSNLDDKKATNWITSWEGKLGYQIFWEFLFKKKFFELSDNLSAAWIAARIIRVANSRDSIMHESLGYLEGGTQILIDKLEKTIIDRGGTINLNSKINKIETKSKSAGGSIIFDNDDIKNSQQYDVIISTIPLPYLLKIMPDLPEDYLNKVKKIMNIGCVCVIFQLKEKLTDNFWLNIDMESWDIPGIIEYSNLRPLENNIVYVPFYCPHTHPNWKLDNEEFIGKAMNYINEINKKAKESIINKGAFRYEYAQPVCPPGFRKILPPMKTGRNGIFAADTSHSYYDDRSIDQSIKIGKALSNLSLECEK